MSKTLKKIWNFVSTVLVAVVVLLALLLAGARIFGLQVFTVLSGSMEPTYHTGSLIYVKKVDPFTIQPGQPITFLLDEKTVATHRVGGVVPDEEDTTVIRFRTKGDANEAEDGTLVQYKNVIGEPVFSIPYLGYLAEYIQHPPGMYVALACGALLLVLILTKRMNAKKGGIAIGILAAAVVTGTAALWIPEKKRPLCSAAALWIFTVAAGAAAWGAAWIAGTFRFEAVKDRILEEREETSGSANGAELYREASLLFDAWAGDHP